MAGPTTTTTTLKGSIWTGYAGDTVGLPALRLPYKDPPLLPSPCRRNRNLRHQRPRHTNMGTLSGPWFGRSLVRHTRHSGCLASWTRVDPHRVLSADPGPHAVPRYAAPEAVRSRPRRRPRPHHLPLLPR